MMVGNIRSPDMLGVEDLWSGEEAFVARMDSHSSVLSVSVPGARGSGVMISFLSSFFKSVA